MVGRTLDDKYGTVRKVGQILDLFCIERPEWGVGEVAPALGLSRSSVSELMSVLEQEGFLRRTPKGRYRVGWRAVSMNRTVATTSEVQEEARKAMEHLLSRFGETIHLTALERGQIVFLDKLHGNKAIQVSQTAVGSTWVVHTSASGKVLLSERPWSEVAEILERRGMEALTPNSITDPQGYREELRLTRERGYAYDVEEGVLELCCVAAPIRDFTGEVVAAMSLSVPRYRFEQSADKYRTALLSVACEVSDRLGHTETRAYRN